MSFGKRFLVWDGLQYSYPKEEIDKVKLLLVNKSDNPNPEYAHERDSGFDLRAWIQEDEDGVRIDKSDNVPYVVLKPLERRLIHTGLYMAVPEFCEVQVRPRSGLALKEGLTILNTPGTVDGGYRNEIGIIVINLSNQKITIKSGERIAQGVICPVYCKELVEMRKVESLDANTERGLDGFGSTNKN